MLRRWLSVLGCSASGACGFAAVGLALYGQGGPAGAAALLFGGFGAVSGLACGLLHTLAAGVPAPRAHAMPAPELARLVRGVLARAAAERQAGVPADRRAPAAPELPACASSAFGH